MLVIIQVTINGCLDNGVKEIKEENNVDKIKQINIDFYKKEKYRYIDINIAFGKHKESIVFKSIFDIIGFNIDRQDEAFFTINCENAEYVGSLIFTEQDLNDIEYKDKNIINLDLYRDLEKAVSTNSSAPYRTKYQANFHPTRGTAQYTFIQNLTF